MNWEEKHWFVKCKTDPEEGKRDHLAYLLGQNWANIAEVHLLTATEFEALKGVSSIPSWADSHEHTFLVRFGHDYRLTELMNTVLDAAVATELVFSLWIRRRDTHAANRAYTNGIPVFFDHQTGFLGEPKLQDLDALFAPDKQAGHASRWRVEMIDPKMTPTTMMMRRLGKIHETALHVVHSVRDFEGYLRESADHLYSQSPDAWIDAARISGYDAAQARAIVAFLEVNRDQLDAAIERMLRVIYEVPV